jgi:hypothetical protein
VVTTTNLGGYYGTNAVFDAGTYTVTVTKAGFVTQSKTVTVGGFTQTITCDFALSR